MTGRGALVALFLGAAPAAAFAAPVCRDDLAILSQPSGREAARFSVEIADDEAERARGLMRRDSLPGGAGMLFVYPSARDVAFWMRDTRIPLDIMFFDAAGRMVSMREKAVPFDETPIPSAAPAQFVLEINGGLARRLGLTEGALLSSPRVPAGGAAAPCR